MPLQKLPPNGPMSVSASAKQRLQLHNRRRTLQTISELSTNDGSLPDFVSSIGIENIRRPRHDNTPGVGRITSRPAKRESLPQHFSSPNIHVPRPSITATPCAQELQTPREIHGRRPVPMTIDQVEGWNAKRERARMQHELAIAEARIQQPVQNQASGNTITGTRMTTGSSQASLKQLSSRSIPLERSTSGSSLSGQAEPRASLGSTNQDAAQYDVRAEVFERASTDSSSYQSRDSAINRSRSGSSNTSYTSQDAPPLPHGYCAELIQQNQNLVSFGESARSKNLNPNRSSRTMSLPTHGFKHTSLPHRYVTASDLRYLPTQQQPQQISAQRARNQALAALTAANSHARPIRRDQYAAHAHSIPHQNRHASLTSHPPNSSAYRKSASPHRDSLRYHAQLEAQRRITSPSPAHITSDMNRMSRHRHSNASRRVSFETRTVPRRESLTQWKNEREEAKGNLHVDHKARIQERVRRANELEQEREKELVLMGKRAAKAESRSCFGGLFAALRGKSA